MVPGFFFFLSVHQKTHSYHLCVRVSGVYLIKNLRIGRESRVGERKGPGCEYTLMIQLPDTPPFFRRGYRDKVRERGRNRDRVREFTF